MSETDTMQAEVRPQGTAPAFADVLCAIRGKEGGFAAVEQAAALTGTQGRLTLLAVTSYRSGGAQRGPAIGPMQAAEILKRAEGIAREVGVPYTSEVDPGSPPARVILDWSARYDLLALGAPESSWPAMWLSVGVGDTALGGFTCPLLVARPLAADRQLGDRIVVASDGTEASNSLIEMAAEIARARSSSVTLVHALGRESPIKRGGRLREAERTLQGQEQILERTLASGSTDLRIEAGRPGAVVKSVANDLDASLVIMGSRRLDGVRGMGSVSRRVVHQARCSVLVVPPETLAA